MALPVVPPRIPPELTAGDTASWDDDFSAIGYTPADGWTLAYRFKARSAAAPLGPYAATAADDGVRFRNVISAATTATWPPGAYDYTARATKSGTVATLTAGLVNILPDPSATADTRTFAQKMVDGLQAYLLGTGISGTLSYSLQSIQVTNLSPEVAQNLLDKYKAIAAQEAAQRAGKTGGRVRHAKFPRTY